MYTLKRMTPTPTPPECPPPPAHLNHIDPVTLLLFVGMILTAITLIFVEKFFHDDAVIFQVFSGLLSAFSGGFFLRINPQKPPQNGP